MKGNAMKWNDNTNLKVRHEDLSPRPRLRMRFYAKVPGHLINQ